MPLGWALLAQTLRKLRAPGRGAALAALLFGSACIIDDGNDRCDANQVLVKGVGFASDSCACVAGAVPDARGYGCALCGANEVVDNGKCACRDGFARGTDTGPCEMSAIGTPCTGNEGCPPAFPYCATDESDRYCSVQNCSATSCPSGYACEQAGGTSYCAKLPVGLGKDCTSDADCAAGEAKTCDMMMTHKCIMTGCAAKQVTCPGFYACCDLSIVVPGFSICMPPSALTMDGQCTFGTKVTP